LDDGVTIPYHDGEEVETVRERPRLCCAIVLIALAAMGCGGPAEEPDGNAAAASVTRSGVPPGLEAAVEANPGDTQTLHALAVALHQNGRREEAVTRFEQLVELKPDTVHLIELGVAYSSVSRAEEAEAAFMRALESSPANPLTLYHLGNMAMSRGDTERAISMYRQAVQNDPEYLVVHFHLAVVLQQAGQFAEAYRSFEAVVALEPTIPLELEAWDASVYHMAALDLRMDATERAVGLLEVLLESTPDHPSAHLLMSQALTKLNRQDEAREHLAIHERIAADQAASATN
jgi:tetratricopeptide (TPR) repeat protein